MYFVPPFCSCLGTARIDRTSIAKHLILSLHTQQFYDYSKGLGSVPLARWGV